MDKIPTAEELADGMLGKGHYPTYTPDAMIEFAKLHVKAALEAAYKNGKIVNVTYSHPDSSEWDKSIDRKSILNAYPEENIR